MKARSGEKEGGTTVPICGREIVRENDYQQQSTCVGNERVGDETRENQVRTEEDKMAKCGNVYNQPGLGRETEKERKRKR